MKHDHSENTDAQDSSEDLMAHNCNAEGLSESGTSSTSSFRHAQNHSLLMYRHGTTLANYMVYVFPRSG